MTVKILNRSSTDLRNNINVKRDPENKNPNELANFC